MKKKNVLIAILVLLALTIWSHNIYQIVIGVTRADQEMGSPTGDGKVALHDTLVSKPRPAFAYSGAHRDPFAHWLQLEKKIKPVPIMPVVKAVPIEPAPPRLRLSGIVRDANGVLAIIEDPQGETHFARAEDVVTGVKLVRIDSSRVIFEFGKRKFELQLQ
ncbi:hypothetical protein L0244_25630 [bacterium]|nr:hypothetical protein [bacterium]MCI0693272.1 hypothetical protein [candidate division KSB1 bacterium]